MGVWGGRGGGGGGGARGRAGGAGWWTRHPATKQGREGEKVRVGDDIILVSVPSERYLVSVRGREGVCDGAAVGAMSVQWGSCGHCERVTGQLCVQ